MISLNIIAFYDPWIVPSLDQFDYFSDVMLLSPVEQAYQFFILSSMAAFEIHTTLSMRLDVYSQSPWLGSWDSLIL